MHTQFSFIIRSLLPGIRLVLLKHKALKHKHNTVYKYQHTKKRRTKKGLLVSFYFSHKSFNCQFFKKRIELFFSIQVFNLCMCLCCNPETRAKFGERDNMSSMQDIIFRFFTKHSAMLVLIDN